MVGRCCAVAIAREGEGWGVVAQAVWGNSQTDALQAQRIDDRTGQAHPPNDPVRPTTLGGAEAIPSRLRTSLQRCFPVQPRLDRVHRRGIPPGGGLPRRRDRPYRGGAAHRARGPWRSISPFPHIRLPSHRRWRRWFRIGTHDQASRALLTRCGAQRHCPLSLSDLVSASARPNGPSGTDRDPPVAL